MTKTKGSFKDEIMGNTCLLLESIVAVCFDGQEIGYTKGKTLVQLEIILSGSRAVYISFENSDKALSAKKNLEKVIFNTKGIIC